MDLKDLENCKKGQDCYILACGPSLNKYDNEETRDKLKNKVAPLIKKDPYKRHKIKAPYSA